MPIYEYECAKCRSEFEVEQRITDDPLKTCPKCKSRRVKRLISRTSFVLKGSGWYSDLYSSSTGKDAKGKEEGSSDGAAASDARSSGADAKPDKGSDSKSDAKPDAKGAAKPEAKSDSKAGDKSGGKPKSSKAVA